MAKDLAYYVKKFSPRSVVGKMGLNVSPDAPNKPILLLSIIEMIATRQIARNQIPLSAELIVTFLKLWSHLEAVRKPDIGFPEQELEILKTYCEQENRTQTEVIREFIRSLKKKIQNH